MDCWFYTAFLMAVLHHVSRGVKQQNAFLGTSAFILCQWPSHFILYARLLKPNKFCSFLCNTSVQSYQFEVLYREQKINSISVILSLLTHTAKLIFLFLFLFFFLDSNSAYDRGRNG